VRRAAVTVAAVVVALAAAGGVVAVTRSSGPTAAHSTASAVHAIRPVRPGAAPAYAFGTVRFAGAIDAEISGINDAGAFTGSIARPGGVHAVFVDSGRAGAPPTFFALPYPSRNGSVQTAGIDAAGEVVGNYTDLQGVLHGFVRSPGGVFARVDVRGAGTRKGEGTEIAGVDAGGVIVGSYVGPGRYARGFIDTDGRVSSYREPDAGRGLAQGTSVEFVSAAGEYGGFYIDSRNRVHGWYVAGGVRHVVDRSGGAAVGAGRGTQLVGVDRTGRLYGIASSSTGTESFTYADGRFKTVRDPRQYSAPGSGTVVLAVNAAGEMVGFYTDGPSGGTAAFVAHAGARAG
jgi:hypothetical protein